jgi:hypothetical protein
MILTKPVMIMQPMNEIVIRNHSHDQNLFDVWNRKSVATILALVEVGRSSNNAMESKEKAISVRAK